MKRITDKSSDGTPFITNEAIQTLGKKGIAKKIAKYEDLEEKSIKETTFSLKDLLSKYLCFVEDIEELLNYRKKKEAGLLIELPCAEGTFVWKIIKQKDSFDDTPYEVPTQIRFRLDMLKDIGKTIFLTYDEAVKKINKN